MPPPASALREAAAPGPLAELQGRDPLPDRPGGTHPVQVSRFVVDDGPGGRGGGGLTAYLCLFAEGFLMLDKSSKVQTNSGSARFYHRMSVYMVLIWLSFLEARLSAPPDPSD